jgi:hypothetical protein
MPETMTARWAAPRSRLATCGYTRSVVPSKRLTSLAIAIALSGAPAVLSACMALCLPGVGKAPSDTDSQSAGHAVHLAVSPASSSAHAHHGSPASNESSATAPTSTSSPGSPEARLGATCTNCCPDGQGVLVSGPGVERADPKSFSATPTVSQVGSFLLTPLGPGASPPSPPVPPPSPTRAPVVLRI